MSDLSQAASLASLSPPARHALTIDAQTAYAKLVVDAPGSAEARDVLELLKPAELLSTPPRNLDAAAAVLSGLWLWHDFLDESHTISQGIETPTGSFWHAIMHRREGDFGNAKYWYRKCAAHPMLPALAARVDVLTQQQPMDKPIFRLTSRGAWDAFAFVDLVEAVHRDPADPRRATVVAIQRIEWQTLFEVSIAAAAAI